MLKPTTNTSYKVALDKIEEATHQLSSAYNDLARTLCDVYDTEGVARVVGNIHSVQSVLRQLKNRYERG